LLGSTSASSAGSWVNISTYFIGFPFVETDLSPLRRRSPTDFDTAPKVFA
jgi:hypothetical protein